MITWKVEYVSECGRFRIKEGKDYPLPSSRSKKHKKVFDIIVDGAATGMAGDTLKEAKDIVNKYLINK